MQNIDLKLGTYLQINPKLEAPLYSDAMFELERILISRYRTGSHNLRIETGRQRCPITRREERLCSCDKDVLLLDCEDVINARSLATCTTLEEFL